MVMAVGYLQGWHEHLSLSTLIRHREWLGDAVADHRALALGAYAALYVAIVALSFPGAAILTIAGGFLFGALTGGFVTVFAATLGATLIFLAARSALRPLFASRAGPALGKLADGFRRDAFSYLLFLRLMPIFPFWLVNLAPALFNVGFRTYVVATFIGVFPGTFAFSFIGAGLDSVIASQQASDPGCADAGTCSIDPAALATPELFLGLAALALVALLTVLAKAWRRRHAGEG
jgi:uncharacterized membrane protein YdjX (TVP38/TMEM64 family)